VRTNKDPVRAGAEPVRTDKDPGQKSTCTLNFQNRGCNT
jgi:hypothetical protein